MLVRDDGISWTVIGQPAHAWLAGQVARAWDPTPPADVLLAIEQHDIAWSEWDRRPPLHGPSGRAASFMEVPTADRLAAWRHVARRLEAQDPYAALLVSMHATNIATRYGNPVARPEQHLREHADDQQSLLERLGGCGVDAAGAARDADLLFCLDALSLALCHGTEVVDLPAVDGRTIRLDAVAGPDAVTLDPWPLVGDELAVGVRARTLQGRFDEEAALHEALDLAPYHLLQWRLLPAA